jgi:hypothetical protein
MKRLVPALAIWACAGCMLRTAPAPAPTSGPTLEYALLLNSAREHVRRGDYQGADSLYQSFAEKYPGSPFAVETLHERATLAFDPANPSASDSVALFLLDAYVEAPTRGAHYAMAYQMRWLHRTLDSLRRDAAVAARNATTQRDTLTAAHTQADRDAMAKMEARIRDLTEELQKTKDELERVKKRLSTPPPGGPPPPSRA